MLLDPSLVGLLWLARPAVALDEACDETSTPAAEPNEAPSPAAALVRGWLQRLLPRRGQL